MQPIQGLLFRVTGRVQGVGFRYFTKTTAVRLGVRGWVQNENDGSVTGFAVGDAEQLQAFTENLAQGPSYSRVDHLETKTAEQADPGPEFYVRRGF